MREKGSFWIAKPPNMWCGVGIKVIKDFSEVPAANPLLCVQKYIKQPLLINNLKFDIRVYLLVTSVEPLRVYIYEEGLARFATEEYTTDPAQVSNNFIHLTNFSINKESDNFINNSDPDQAEARFTNYICMYCVLLISDSGFKVDPEKSVEAFRIHGNREGSNMGQRYE